MLRKIITQVLLVILACTALTIGLSAPASADSVFCDPVTSKCYTVIDQPPSDPPSNPNPSTGFTPGASSCGYTSWVDGKTISVPCSTGANYWSNGYQCYISVAADQAARPASGAPTGAWYLCTQIIDPRCASIPAGSWGTPADLYACIRGVYGVTFWSNTPPPGINTLTPAQAAYRLVQTFQLTGINIGFAPDPNTPGSKSYVGIPIWMWVNAPTPLSYGPYSETATLGGVTITATAHVTSILWNMGDGHTVPCANAGTSYQVSFGVVDSPNCGYRYYQMSNTQAGGKYTVTATSQWSVDWTGGGQAGTIPLSTTSRTAVEIRELQSVNVGK